MRFGGVQWGTDFSLQPDRITFPLPTISGQRSPCLNRATLRQRRAAIADKTCNPVSSASTVCRHSPGAGDLSIVIRDSLGRLQTVTQPFYASPRLLAPGLDSYTVESGFLREGLCLVR